METDDEKMEKESTETDDRSDVVPTGENPGKGAATKNIKVSKGARQEKIDNFFKKREKETEMETEFPDTLEGFGYKFNEGKKLE